MPALSESVMSKCEGRGCCIEVTLLQSYLILEAATALNRAEWQQMKMAMGIVKPVDIDCLLA